MSLVAAVLGGVALAWAALVAALWWVRPDDLSVREALRLLPDTARLLARIARDPAVPRGVRIRLWLAIGYLALPLDLVPDVLPVVGYADDVVVVAWVLRSVVRRAGTDAVRRHWPGTPAGLEALLRLTVPRTAGRPGHRPDGQVDVDR